MLPFEIFPRRYRLAFRRAQLGLRDEPAEVLVTGAIGDEKIEVARSRVSLDYPWTLEPSNPRTRKRHLGADEARRPARFAA